MQRKESYEYIKNILNEYNKNEICELLGIAYKSFLEENCDINISIPVLILVGEYDKTGKVKKYCKAWQKETEFPFVIVPNAAHNSNYDNYDFVNDIILKFIRDEI